MLHAMQLEEPDELEPPCPTCGRAGEPGEPLPSEIIGDRVLVAPCQWCGRCTIADADAPPILICRCGAPLVVWLGAPAGTSVTEAGAIEYPSGHVPWRGRSPANDNGRPAPSPDGRGGDKSCE